MTSGPQRDANRVAAGMNRRRISPPAGSLYSPPAAWATARNSARPLLSVSSRSFVAAQVDQHQVLGALLRVGQQLGIECRVGLGRGAALAGAGDGPHGELAALQPHQDLG